METWNEKEREKELRQENYIKNIDDIIIKESSFLPLKK